MPFFINAYAVAYAVAYSFLCIKNTPTGGSLYVFYVKSGKKQGCSYPLLHKRNSCTDPPFASQFVYLYLFMKNRGSFALYASIWAI